VSRLEGTLSVRVGAVSGAATAGVSRAHAYCTSDSLGENRGLGGCV
jgi:hypothetical protein